MTKKKRIYKRYRRGKKRGGQRYWVGRKPRRHYRLTTLGKLLEEELKKKRDSGQLEIPSKERINRQYKLLIESIKRHQKRGYDPIDDYIATVVGFKKDPTDDLPTHWKRRDMRILSDIRKGLKRELHETGKIRKVPYKIQHPDFE